MGKNKKGFNSVVFWTIAIFILIIVAGVLFFTDIFDFNKGEIKQVKLGEDKVEISLSNVSIRDSGIDFTLNVDPKKEEIKGIKFIFEGERGQSETITRNVNYNSPSESFYSIDLNEIDPNEVNKILIVPILNQRQNNTAIAPVDSIYNTINEDYVNSSDYVQIITQGSSSSSSGGGGGGSSSSSTTTTTPQEVVCTLNHSLSCYAGNVYWYDSCGEIQEVRTLCSGEESCQDGQCIFINESVDPVCGNGILEVGEFCDGIDLVGETCVSFGFGFGTLSCADNCEFDVSNCSSFVEEPDIINQTNETNETVETNETNQTIIVPEVVVPNFITNNVLAWWSFENNVEDSVGTNHGTNNGAIYTSEGISSGAYDFDGSSSWIEIPYSSSIDLVNNGAISLYFNADTLNTGTHNLFSHGGRRYGEGYLINQNGQDLRIYWGDSGTLLLVPTVFSINTWHHVVVSNNNGAITVYVDGNNVGSVTSSGPTNSQNNFFIGSSSDDWYFDGRIDEVILFDRALNSSEVSELNDYVGSGGNSGEEEPDVCTPDCIGRDCGDDGCGGNCGTCSGDDYCNSNGLCITPSPEITGSLNDLLCPTGFYDSGSPCLELSFPTAEGYGRFSQGGRGGTVYHVTNLGDSGVGSLRYGLEMSGPRTIVFDVGGIIDIANRERRIDIEDPYVTIAGQTAPGDGIMIRGGALLIETNDIIIRHVRIRPGVTEGSVVPSDALTLYGYFNPSLTNIIYDHVSTSWGTDGLIDIWPMDAENGGITYQYCILAETLADSIHEDGNHSRAMLVGRNAQRMSIIKNLFAHNNARHPHMQRGNNNIDVINNIMYDWGNVGIHFNNVGVAPANVWEINIMNNYWKIGPSTLPDRVDPLHAYAWYLGQLQADSNLHISGNIIDLTGTTQSIEEAFPTNHQNYYVDRAFDKTQKAPEALSNLMTAQETYTHVLSEVGNTVPMRDSVDTRIINEVQTRTGQVINCVDPGDAGECSKNAGGWPSYSGGTPPTDTDQDGMPDAWETFHCLNPSVADNNGYDLSTIYTNVEVYLNELAGDFGGTLPSQC